MTDLTATVSLNGATDLKYDDSTGQLYVEAAGALYQWNPQSGTAVGQVSIANAMASFDLTADGQYALVVENGNYLDRVQLSNLSIDRLAYPAPDGGFFGPPSLIDVAATSTGVALAATYYPSISPNTGPLGSFDPEATILTASSVATSGWGGIELVTSEDRRYVLIVDMATSAGGLEIYDSSQNKIVASGGVFGAFNTGKASISSAAGLIADLTYNTIEVMDLNLGLQKDLSSLQFAGSIVGVQFSADGHDLFLWDSAHSEILAYDVRSWTQVGSMAVDVGVTSQSNGSPVGRMAASEDGRFLFLNTGAGFEALDLASRLHLTVSGDASHALLYGSVGSDILTGGLENDRLQGGGGNDTLTGGGGADTFVFQPGVGNAVVADFSHAQGDAIDLSGFGTLHSLSDVLAAATQVGADTVVTLGSGSVTLQNVQMSNLTASDFDFVGTVKSSTDVVTFDAGSTPSATAGPLIQFNAPSGGTAINRGTMTLVVNSEPVTAVTTSAEPYWRATFENDGNLNVSGIMPEGVAFAVTDNNGIFNVTGTSASYTATGATGDVVNTGSMTVQGAGTAVGVSDQSGGTFQNLGTGTFSVSSATGSTGVFLIYATDYENDGLFSVSSTGGSSLGLSYSAAVTSTIINTGTFTVSGTTSRGIVVNGSYPASTVSLQNSGTITAQTAITYGGTVAGNINNSGTINGDVVLISGANQIVNTGSINGAVTLGSGDDRLDSHSGTITGTVTLGTGSSTVTLGVENNTVASAAGTHVVDGGGGTNTISYASAASGVTVSLAAQGSAQSTGVGTDTLTNFKNLVGSAYGDTLTAGNGTSTLTGGAGADIFQIQSGADSTTINDFSHVQGDKIVISGASVLGSFADVQAHAQLVGSDTVINLGSGALTLKNVAPGDLVASDFSFFGPYSPINVTGPLTIDAGQNLTFNGSNAGYGAYAVSSTGSLKVYGAVLVQDTQANDVLSGVDTSGSAGTPIFWVETGGSFSVNATGSGDSAYGFYSGLASAGFKNDGTFSVSSAAGAIGVDLEAGGLFVNHGSMTVTGQGAITTGLLAAGSFAGSNFGSINVSGAGLIDGVDLDTNANFTNTGTITATSSGGASYGILAGDSAGRAALIANSGTITAQYAVNALTGAGPMDLTNSGILNGAVVFGTAAGNELLNTGAINGHVTFNGITGQQLYDGRGGTLSGGVTFASGTGVTGLDYAYLGNDGETLQGGSAALYAYGGAGADHVTGGAGIAYVDGGGGNDVLDGGSSGQSIAIFNSATNGVTVSLALQGQAQNTGVGTDTLSNFRNLVGSTFNDHLTGDANDNIMEGDGGDDVMDGGGGFNTVSFGAASHGVTVSLALQGQAQSTGVGAETLTNFRAILGSAYNDTLEGGGPAASSLTGGGGADTFVYRSGDGYVTIQDFSAAQGDKIDLSSLTGFRSFSDVQTHIFLANGGADTVIDIGAAGLLLGGVSAYSLTAADFIFYAGPAVGPGLGGAPTTGNGPLTGTSGSDWLQGGSGNDTLHGGAGGDYLDGGSGLNTATYSGAYRQYTIGAGGSTVSGGPEGGTDDLTHIQRIQFADGYLATSPTDTAGQVYRIYEATLGRAPDQEGLTNWVNGLNSGASLQSVVGGFVNSTEFQQVYGPLDDPHFVTLLYHNVLHRDPDQAGLNNWVGMLTSGQETRAQVVLGFSESPEDVNDLAAPVQQGLWIANPDAGEVARLYDTVLGRLPDGSGLANWTHSLESGASLQSVADGFVGSAEFQAVYGTLNNSDFVTLLYHNVLHRDPDQAGLTNWVSNLASGETRAQVVVGFSESAEHITNTAAHVDSGIWLAS